MNDWTGINTSVAPAVEPVLAVDVRNELSLTDTSDDTWIATIAQACREAIEKYLGRTFITTTYEVYFDKFPSCIELIRPPVQSITSIVYNDADGDEQTLDSSKYRLDSVSVLPRVTPAYGETWPDTRIETNAVKVTYKAGYGDASGSVPMAIKKVIAMMAADAYEHREAQSELTLKINSTYQLLLSSYKIDEVY